MVISLRGLESSKVLKSQQLAHVLDSKTLYYIIYHLFIPKGETTIVTACQHI